MVGDTTRAWLSAATLVVGLSTMACSNSNSTSTPTPTAASAEVASTPPSSASAPSLSASTTALSSSAEQQAAVQAALQDAAAYLGVATASLTVDRVEPRQWGDASLGCPQPDIMYSQVVTPGFLIVIGGADRTLEYHSDTRQRVVLCQPR